MYKLILCIVLLFSISALGGGVTEKDEEILREAGQKRCGVCEVGINLLLKEIEGKNFTESVIHVHTLNNRDAILNLIMSLPDFGGKNDVPLMHFLGSKISKFNFDLYHKIAESGSASRYCIDFGPCDVTLEYKEECDTCPEGCCTSFGECYCGTENTKRTVIPYHHPLLEHFTEDMYTYIISKEEIEQQHARVDKLQEEVNEWIKQGKPKRKPRTNTDVKGKATANMDEVNADIL